jgi:cyclohexyl-isocyanide hydratase
MNRRTFNTLAAAAIGSLAASGAANAEKHSQPTPSAHPATEAEIQAAMQQAMAPTPRLQIAMLIYPQFTALDLIGPHTFLAGLMNADVHLVWKNHDPVPLDRGGTALVPTRSLDECPRDLDVLFVPGGLKGTLAVMQDDQILDFLADRGSRAKYITSVCTGSLVLGCAGLLNGYRATTHWSAQEILPLLGAIPVNQRVVEDRNRLTGAGVTSGMDFGLVLAAKLSTGAYAEMLQLINEYDPQPPFDAGSPAKAGAPMTSHLRQMLAPGIAGFHQAADSSRKRWKT